MKRRYVSIKPNVIEGVLWDFQLHIQHTVWLKINHPIKSPIEFFINMPMCSLRSLQQPLLHMIHGVVQFTLDFLIKFNPTQYI